MSFDAFKSHWLGKRVDTDGVPRGRIYQCVDLIKRYMRDTKSVPFGSYGNAIQYWTNTHPNVLKKFTKVPGSNAKKGDIVVLKGLAGNPYGHVGIATGRVTPSTVEILEQNGSTGNGSGLGNDKIRTRFVARARVAGLLRPKSAVAPSPPPAKKYHKVVRGDTVDKISRKYGLKIDPNKKGNARYPGFTKLNPLVRNVNLIYPGQTVRVG